MNGIIVKSKDAIVMNDPEPVDAFHKQTPSDLVLQNKCLVKLNSEYPGIEWRVDVNSGRGTCDIFCVPLSSRWGHRYHLGRIYVDPDLHWVMIAGGELLERAKRSRGRWEEDLPVGWVEGIRPQDQPINGMPI